MITAPEHVAVRTTAHAPCLTGPDRFIQALDDADDG